MSMKTMDSLRDKFYEELEKIDRKPEMGAGDLELAHKLTDTIKNIDKICIMDESGEYSQAGDWEARGRFGDMYSRDDGENSYAGRRRDAMGRFSGNGGTSYRGGRRGGYSRSGGLMEHVDMMMDEADTDEQRDMIRRFKKQLESMR